MLEEIIIGRDSDDLKKYGKKGCVFLGKNIVGAGWDSHLANPILMDVMRPHVIMVVGKRGSGKSYSGGVIAEEIMNLPEDIGKNLSCLLIDTMGIFWSMKEPNDEGLLILKEWGLETRGFDVKNIVPIGMREFYNKAGIEYDDTISIDASKLSANDWALTFQFNLYGPMGILLERIMQKLKGKYSIDDIIKEIENDKKSDKKIKFALENRFLAAKGWGIFSDKEMSIKDFIKHGCATVIDISMQQWNVRNLLLGIIAREIYELRMGARREEEKSLISGESVKRVPMTWIIMDEAHNFLPADGKTAASEPLLTLVSQGRQPGISTVFITQRPNKLHEDVVAQSDLVISHRLTAKPDLDALSSVMQTYLLENIRKSITNLPKAKGSAVILDDNSERLFNIQVRPRQSWHAGSSPIGLR